MKQSNWRIQNRIAIPFTMLFLVAILLVTTLSQSLMSRTLEERLRERVERASEVIAMSDFALNRPILERLKLLVDADIVTYTRDGEILATTFDEVADREKLELIGSTQPAAAVLANPGRLVLRDVEYRGAPYTLVYRPIPDRSDTLIAFAVEASDVRNAVSALGRAMAAIALVAVLAMALVSHFIARGLASPITELADFTRSIASGHRDRRAPERGSDEVRRLARSFNEMVEQLGEYESKLLRSEKLAVTGLLAAQVAHEVRNPLLSMKMEAQLFQSRLEPGTRDAEIVQAILREIDRVEAVVKGLLELARPGELRLAATDVNRAVSEVLDLMNLQLRHRKIEVVRDLDPSLPAVPLDADRFKQALLNVILNAAESMTKSGRLTVTTSSEPGAGEIVIEVIDQGSGVDPSIRERLFDPFVSTKREGVGLGLVNAKSVVERHRGRIRLDDGPGGSGTRVVISLPIEPAGGGLSVEDRSVPGEKIHG